MKKEFKTNVAHFNTETGDKILYPFGPPIFQSEVDQTFVKKLLDEGQKLNIKENDHNFRLAGQHKYGRSYAYTEEFENQVEPYLIKYVERFFNGMMDMFGERCDMPQNVMTRFYNKRDYRVGKLKLDTLWINYSQKHDFNPPHTHIGELSFIIYCKVPEEIFSVQADSNTQRAGQVHFNYGEQASPMIGAEFPIRPYENLMLIFPSKLRHHVPAYWVDAERISVSGNFIVV